MEKMGVNSEYCLVPAESLSDFYDEEKTLEEQSYPECQESGDRDQCWLQRLLLSRHQLPPSLHLTDEGDVTKRREFKASWFSGALEETFPRNTSNLQYSSHSWSLKEGWRLSDSGLFLMSLISWQKGALLK